MESLSGNLYHVWKSPFFTQSQTQTGNLLQLVGLIPEFNLGGFEVRRKVITTAIATAKPNKIDKSIPNILRTWSC